MWLLDAETQTRRCEGGSSGDRAGEGEIMALSQIACWMWASKWGGTPAHRVVPGSRAPDCEGGGADKVEECGPQGTRYLMRSVSLRSREECVRTERTCAPVRGALLAPKRGSVSVACACDTRSQEEEQYSKRRARLKKAEGLKHIRSDVALDEESAGYTRAHHIDAARFAERESLGPD